MKKFIILASLLAVSSVAFANNDGNGDDHSHGNGDDKSHQHDGGGSGGQGGLGGAGGSSSSTSNNTNNNANLQGQLQGQVQGQKQSISNSGNSSATGGSVSGSGNSTNTNTLSTGASTATVGDVSTGASTSEASNNGNGSNNTEINYQNYRAPVNTAYAPSLTSGFDTCLGSVSGGVQTQILGLSGGGTKVDKNCVLIKQVHLLKEMGMNNAACIRAHDDADMARAMDAAGVDCSSYDKPKIVEKIVVVEKEKVVYTQDPAWNAPQEASKLEQVAPKKLARKATPAKKDCLPTVTK
jgi:hypothetical protein